MNTRTLIWGLIGLQVALLTCLVGWDRVSAPSASEAMEKPWIDDNENATDTASASLPRWLVGPNEKLIWMLESTWCERCACLYNQDSVVVCQKCGQPTRPIFTLMKVTDSEEDK